MQKQTLSQHINMTSAQTDTSRGMTPIFKQAIGCHLCPLKGSKVTVKLIGFHLHNPNDIDSIATQMLSLFLRLNQSDLHTQSQSMKTITHWSITSLFCIEGQCLHDECTIITHPLDRDTGFLFPRKAQCLTN